MNERVAIGDAPADGFHCLVMAFANGAQFVDGYLLGIITIALPVLPKEFGLDATWKT